MADNNVGTGNSSPTPHLEIAQDSEVIRLNAEVHSLIGQLQKRISELREQKGISIPEINTPILTDGTPDNYTLQKQM